MDIHAHTYNIWYIIQVGYIYSIMYIIFKVNSHIVLSSKYWILDVLQRFTFQKLVCRTCSSIRGLGYMEEVRFRGDFGCVWMCPQMEYWVTVFISFLYLTVKWISPSHPSRWASFPHIQCNKHDSLWNVAPKAVRQYNLLYHYTLLYLNY